MVTFLREYMGKEKGFTFNIRVKPFLHCKDFKFCFKILNSL